MDCWINGTVAITDETIVAFPRSKVQQHAMDLTGQLLPPEAFAVYRWPTTAKASARIEFMMSPGRIDAMRRVLQGGVLHSSDGDS